MNIDIFIERKTEEKIRRAIEENGMLKKGDRVVLAVSGGADSMTLLYVLYYLADEYALDLKVCHVNHGLRGAQADGDEELVRKNCQELKIPFLVKKADVRELCRRMGIGEEECGRRIRYEFFDECANGGKIATAHTLSDKAETLIFNLTRGSSLKGLCSIPPVRGNIIRPLILCAREDIEEFCEKNGIEYAVDCTNSDIEYSRNRIRHEVIPQLKVINPAFLTAVENLSESCALDEKFLSGMCDKALDEAYISENVYSAEVLSRLDKALLLRAVVRIIENSGSEANSRRAKEAADSVINGGSVNLSSGRIFKCDGKKVWVCLPEQAYGQNGEIGDFCFPFCEGETVTPAGTVTIKKSNLEKYSGQKGCAKINNLLLYNVIGCDRISKDLVIRNKRPGDRITLYKRSVTKSLKKLFYEQKIKPQDRSRQIVIADKDGVLWVQSAGPDKRALPKDKNSEIYEITVRTNDETGN